LRISQKRGGIGLPRPPAAPRAGAQNAGSAILDASRLADTLAEKSYDIAVVYGQQLRVHGSFGILATASQSIRPPLYNPCQSASPKKLPKTHEPTKQQKDIFC
jgi:hypothetical protein